MVPREPLCRLRPFQRRFVKAVESGRFDVCALSLPRGNGKSWLAAELCRRALTPGDTLFAPGYESVLLAASLEQARIVFKFVRRALEGDSSYRFQDSANRVGVIHRPTNTRIRALGSNGKTAMGLGADTALAICDEPACWETVGGQLLADAVFYVARQTGQPDASGLHRHDIASRGWWLVAGVDRRGNVRTHVHPSAAGRPGTVGSVAGDPALQSVDGGVRIVPGEASRGT